MVRRKNESTVPISRVLFRIPKAAVPAIYPIRESPHGFSVPPSAGVSRAGYPQTAVYMNLQPPAGTARRSPDGRWSLTHAFSPLPASVAGGCFLLPWPTVTNSFYFRKWSALRCPDFPPVPFLWAPAADRDTAFKAQNYHFFLYWAKMDVLNLCFTAPIYAV